MGRKSNVKPQGTTFEEASVKPGRESSSSSTSSYSGFSTPRHNPEQTCANLSEQIQQLGKLNQVIKNNASLFGTEQDTKQRRDQVYVFVAIYVLMFIMKMAHEV